MHPVELLAPAGDLECLRTALRFGADAVYIGGPMLQMRAKKAGFSMDDVFQAAEIVHNAGKKLYVTVNSLAWDEELPLLKDYARKLHAAGVDAVIVSDLGVMSTLRDVCPELEIHVSTQVSCTNAASARAYAQMGASRIVLAREMTLERIRAMHASLGDEIPLEVFAHGAMCMAHSGRCLLSSHMTGRNGNRGECAQSCRWTYHVMEEKRPGQFFPVEEDETGTTIFSSRDLCTMPFLRSLMECGVSSLKIEGRMKTAYYVATVVNAYRMAIDAVMAGNEPDAAILHELDCFSHRPYCSGFYLGEKDVHMHDDGVYEQSCAFLGVVECVENGFITFHLKNRILKGMTAQLLTPGSTGKSFTIEEIRNAQGESTDIANIPQEIYSLHCPYDAREGDILRLCL